MDQAKKIPRFCSSLTELYYDEAKRCLEAKCYIASIALSWAAIDYAIEHELSGGSRVNSRTFLPHQQLPYNAMLLSDKLEKLSSLFPELSAEWSTKLNSLYKQFRNTFLHAKLSNISERTLPGTTLKAIRIKPPLIPHDKKNTQKPSQNITVSPEERLDKEQYLIALAESSAASVFKQTTDFLSALGVVISNRAFPPDEGSLGKLE